jgi:hypothetical protein
MTISDCLNSPSPSISSLQAKMLCSALYEQYFYGCYTLSSFSPKDTATFVEYGFARHRITETVIDKLLTIVAGLQWANIMFPMFQSLHPQAQDPPQRI